MQEFMLYYSLFQSLLVLTSLILLTMQVDNKQSPIQGVTAFGRYDIDEKDGYIGGIS